MTRCTGRPPGMLPRGTAGLYYLHVAGLHTGGYLGCNVPSKIIIATNESAYGLFR